MTKHFEVLRRDGPARLGKLILERQISTPALISSDDWISAGSVFRYESLQEATEAAMSLKGQKKLTIEPYVPSSLHCEPALRIPPLKIDGPKGLVVHPFSLERPEDADVYVLAFAGALKNPRDLVQAVVGVRNKTPPDTALYAPALARPASLALLVYLGIDLLDATRVLADGYLGRYHTRDGVWNLDDLDELPCRCEHCRRLQEDRANRKLLASHNLLKLEEERLVVRETIRSGTIREYVERQVRVEPDLTAALRLLDQEHTYLEKRTPQHRRSIFLPTPPSPCSVWRSPALLSVCWIDTKHPRATFSCCCHAQPGSPTPPPDRTASMPRLSGPITGSCMS